MKKTSSLGIGFTGSPYGAAKIADLAKLAEESRLDSFWIAEDYFLRDSITLLSCVAYATKEIELGSGIINPFTRHPALIAQTAATLAELSNGRFTLGLGSGDLKLISSLGKNIDHPLRSMRESIEIIRTLLTGEQINFAGSEFTISNVKLGINPYISQSNRDNFGKRTLPVKIYLAAIGPKMLDLAGRIGDGVMLTAGISCETAKRSCSDLRTARSKSELPGRFDLSAYIIACLGTPSVSVKLFVADLVNQWPENFFSSGISEKHVNDLRDAYSKKGIRLAVPYVTEEMIGAVVACGTMAEIEKKISEYRKSGVDYPIIIPMETPAEKLIKSLGV